MVDQLKEDMKCNIQFPIGRMPVWLGSVVVRALDLQSTGHGSTPGRRIAE